MNPWLTLLEDLNLSRQEKEVVERFAANANGLTFLPVVEVFKAHKLDDEAIEFLTWGVERHPHYPAARVFLAKDLFLRGMIESAWEKLQAAPKPLLDNTLAQSVTLRCAILLGYESAARSCLQHMKRCQMLDKDNRLLGSTLEIEGIGKARLRLLEEFKRRQVHVQVPRQGPDENDIGRSSPIADLSAPILSQKMTVSEDFLTEKGLSHFHVVPLHEVFGSEAAGEESATPLPGIELDTPTLAEIYENQGHYGKSLAVYRRLLKLSPHNEYLRKRVSELARKEQEQRQNDLTVDPALIDKMEAIEGIDRQMHFFNQLLDRLT